MLVRIEPLSLTRAPSFRGSIHTTTSLTRGGFETQRQWSDQAIHRTTPLLLGLFSLVTLWATELAATREAQGARRGLVQEAGANLCGLPCCHQADPLGRGGSQPDPVAGGLSDLAGRRTNRRKTAPAPAAPGRAD